MRSRFPKRPSGPGGDVSRSRTTICRAESFWTRGLPGLRVIQVRLGEASDVAVASLNSDFCSSTPVTRNLYLVLIY